MRNSVIHFLLNGIVILLYMTGRPIKHGENLLCAGCNDCILVCSKVRVGHDAELQ